jgi:hypothetical protein
MTLTQKIAEINEKIANIVLSETTDLINNQPNESVLDNYKLSKAYLANLRLGLLCDLQFEDPKFSTENTVFIQFGYFSNKYEFSFDLLIDGHGVFNGFFSTIENKPLSLRENLIDLLKSRETNTTLSRLSDNDFTIVTEIYKCLYYILVDKYQLSSIKYYRENPIEYTFPMGSFTNFIHFQLKESAQFKN